MTSVPSSIFSLLLSSLETSGPNGLSGMRRVRLGALITYLRRSVDLHCGQIQGFFHHAPVCPLNPKPSTLNPKPSNLNPKL